MNASITNFFGGSPGAVVLRLLVLSFVVGLFLMMWGFEPEDIFNGVARAVNHVIDYGLRDLHNVWRVLATGALVVVPLWLVSRLMGVKAR